MLLMYIVFDHIVALSGEYMSIRFELVNHTADL
jgi:hypothetical protein